EDRPRRVPHPDRAAAADHRAGLSRAALAASRPVPGSTSRRGAMRASTLFALVFGAAAGFGAAVMFAPRGGERAPSREGAPEVGAPTRWGEVLAPLDPIAPPPPPPGPAPAP